MLQITNRKSLVIWSRGAQIARISPNRCLKRLKSHFQIARFVIWASVQIVVRIAMPFSCTSGQNNELFWEASQCFKLTDWLTDRCWGLRITNRNRSQIARSQRAQRLKKINLDWKLQTRLKNFNLDWKFQSWPSEFPTKNRGFLDGALELFNLDWKFQSRRAILNFFNLWALRDLEHLAHHRSPHPCLGHPMTCPPKRGSKFTSPF